MAVRRGQHRRAGTYSPLPPGPRAKDDDFIIELLRVCHGREAIVKALHAAMPLQNGSSSPDHSGSAKLLQCIHNGEPVTIKPMQWGCNKMLDLPKALGAAPTWSPFAS